jgi:hypothetical protein
LKSGCKGFQGLKEVLRRRGVFYEIKKDCYLLAFESTGISCMIDKGWTGGLKISSRKAFDQPPVGRAFS